MNLKSIFGIVILCMSLTATASSMPKFDYDELMLQKSSLNNYGQILV